ncbi:MAG: T9SS C-terminal target domain-containing protein [Balneolaceae bacterium]|nr:MAG: T9SS C-terminal target domain-containing protein [Balneolaceae bacterium]
MKIQRRFTLILLTLLIFLPGYVSGQSNYSDLLFEIIEEGTLSDSNVLTATSRLNTRNEVRQSYLISVSDERLHQLRNSVADSFTMYDVNGNLISIEVSRVIEHYNGDWSLLGSVNGDPVNSFTLSYSGGKLLSVINHISSHSFMEITYSADNGQHYLLEIDPHLTDRLSCGVDHSADRFRREGSPTEASLSLPHSTGRAVIDVLVVYTPAAESWANTNQSGIQNVINQAMAIAQTSADNSALDLEFRLVHSARVEFVESGDSGDDLEKLTDGEIPGVHELRDQYGADLVALFSDTDDTGGIAWMPTSNIATADDFGFSITRVQQAHNTATHAHEMGHNMGNNHSRNQKDSAAEEEGGIFEYSTGWRWVGNDGNGYHSVMTYDERADDDENGDPIYDIEVFYFSNPDVTHQGQPTGSYQGEYAPADIARSMREVMHAVSNWRTPQTVTEYSLTTSVTGSGSITPSAGTFASGTAVNLTATPAEGWRFTVWGGDASGSGNPVTVTMNSNKNVTATFTEVTQEYTLSGTVTDGSSPMEGVTVTASGGFARTALTSAQGQFLMTGVPGGVENITITPSLSGYSFEPAQRVVTGPVNANITNLNFTAQQESFKRPENLTLEYSDGTVNLSWDPISSGSLIGYDIYRSTRPNTLELYEVVDSETTVFQDTPDETMFYAVSAYYENDIESSLSNVVSFYTKEITVGDGWQLISIPLNNGINTPYQSVSFDGVYTRVNRFTPGRGFWVRHNSQEIFRVAGSGYTSAEIEIKSGWNLLGGLADSFSPGDILDPGNILSGAPVYEYNGSTYNPVTSSIGSGNGFWIHADQSGTISYQIGGSQTGKVPAKPFVSSTIEGLHRLEFNSNGVIQNIWISEDELERDELVNYLMPPMAPNTILDIRTADQYSITDQTSVKINLTAKHYPVTVNFFHGRHTQNEDSYRLTGFKDNEEIHLKLDGNQSVIPYQMDSLVLEKVRADDFISTFKLYSNYPNPFNPVTNIRYELPQQSPVRIEVFDISGRRIALLLETTQQAGIYTIQFDGSGISSGLYYLRFQASGYSAIQPITLIK